MLLTHMLTFSPSSQRTEEAGEAESPQAPWAADASADADTGIHLEVRSPRTWSEARDPPEGGCETSVGASGDFLGRGRSDRAAAQGVGE